MKRILGSLTFLAAAVFALPAGAVTWTADNSDLDGVGYGCFNRDCQYQVGTTGAGDAMFKAYSVNATAGSQNGAGPIAGSWIEGDISFWSGGYGINNTNQVANTEEDGSPQHGIDNIEVLDLMVIALPQTDGKVWDITSLTLGWTNNGTTKISAFIGGADLAEGYDFRNVCFDSAVVTGGGACNSAGQVKLSSLGFSDISNAVANNGFLTGSDTSIALNTNKTGNYLIVSGALGGSDDAFKLKAITGTQVKIPLPGTLALLGLGLFGLVANRRRAALA